MTWDIAIADVPDGHRFCQVEAGSRGRVQLTRQEAKNGEFAGSLG